VNDLAVAVMKATSEKNEAARLRQEALDKIDSEKRRQAAAEKATAGVPCAGMLEDEQRSACPALVGHFRIQSDARDMLARLTEQEPALLERVLNTSSAVATSELSRKEAEAEVLKIDRELVVLRERYVHNKSSLEALRRRDRSAELQMAEREASVLDTSLSLAKENAAAATADLAVAQAEYQKALAAVLPADGLALAAAVMAESSARQALDAARVRDQEARSAVVRLDTQISTAREAQARAEALRERLAPLERDLADWRWLGRALGREGVQALELDAAGPRISALANELLTDAYGSRFQLRFETQAAKADGKGVKETFDVVVVDTERGREGSGEDLSGGEKVIVGEALGLAVGLFHAQAAGVSLGTVVRDETVGALDPENGERYLAMLRAFLRVGRVHQLLYVAHNPALVELADAVVHIEDGRIEVR
jgi:exonuclease SbcC